MKSQNEKETSVSEFNKRREVRDKFFNELKQNKEQNEQLKEIKQNLKVSNENIQNIKSGTNDKKDEFEKDKNAGKTKKKCVYFNKFITIFHEIQIKIYSRNRNLYIINKMLVGVLKILNF